MLRWTSACLLIFALSAIVFPQLWQEYLAGPPVSLILRIIASSTLFKSRMMEILRAHVTNQSYEQDRRQILCNSNAKNVINND